MPPHVTDDSPAGAATPEAAFALIGNEIRADILRVLGEDPHTPVTFSELRSRVDEDIDSGQFNYHLQQMVGQFVDHEDGEESTYRLRAEGRTLYRTIRAGTFTRRATVEWFDAGFDCYFCGAAVEGGYEDGAFQLQCPACDHVYVHTTAPPSTVEGAEREDLLDRIDRYNRDRILSFRGGVCPICVNGMDQELLPGEEVWSEGSEDLDVFVHHDCDYCGNQHYLSVGMALLHEPHVVSFFHERGVDVTAVRHWEFEFVMTDHYTTVRSREPWEVALEITCEGDTLELVVDESLVVLSATLS
jgi:hypothetical protein